VCVQRGRGWEIWEAISQIRDHLEEGRCEGAEGCGESGDVGRFDVRPDDLHPRPERRRPFAFAAPPQENDRSVIAYGGSELFDRACLSDPRLADYQHELGRSRESSFERGVECSQLVFAADEDGTADFSRGRARPTRLSGGDGVGDFRDFGDESVAAAAKCLDEDGVGWIVAEGLADGCDAGWNRRDAHRRRAPYLAYQLVLRYEAVPVAYQVGQYIEDPRPDIDDSPAAPELVERGVELEITEDLGRQRLPRVTPKLGIQLLIGFGARA
jgi:hypothetical protein